VFAVISGWLTAKHGPRLPLTASGLLIAAGAVLLIAVGTHTSVWYLIVAYVVFGAGSGLVAPPITNTALSGMPRDQAGVAGAIASTCRQVGAALGVAVTGCDHRRQRGRVRSRQPRCMGGARRLRSDRGAARHRHDRTLGAGDGQAKRCTPRD
jgi:hypothetical protein